MPGSARGGWKGPGLPVQRLHRLLREHHLRRAHQLLQLLQAGRAGDEAEAAAASQRVKATGLLRLNVPLSFGRCFVAPLIPEFCQRHPEVTVELGLSDAELDIIAGSWDLAVRIGRLADSQLQARRLGDSPMLVCAAPSYLDRRGMPRRVAELTQHNCLSYTLSGTQDRKHWAFGRNGEHRVPVSGNLVANNGDALVAAAVRGQGVIYQPRLIVGGRWNGANWWSWSWTVRPWTWAGSMCWVRRTGAPPRQGAGDDRLPGRGVRRVGLRAVRPACARQGFSRGARAAGVAHAQPTMFPSPSTTSRTRFPSW